jgi:hypothetical protein
MSELSEAVETRLLAEKDQGETVTLWRRVWACYEQGGAEAVEELMGSLLVLPEERA